MGGFRVTVHCVSLNGAGRHSRMMASVQVGPAQDYRHQEWPCAQSQRKHDGAAQDPRTGGAVVQRRGRSRGGLLGDPGDEIVLAAASGLGHGVPLPPDRGEVDAAHLSLF